MSLVLLIAPWRERTPQSTARMETVKRELVQAGLCPLFLPHAIGDVLNDNDPDQRALALRLSRMFVATLATIPDCEAVQLGERLTEGMAIDVQAWVDAGRKAPKLL